MPTLAFVLPVVPGKEAFDREMMERFSSGEEKGAYAASRRAQGITRETVWQQETPNGTVAIVVFEADDPESAARGLATSEEPFDRRFREYALEAHGVDLASDPPPAVRLISDARF